MNLRDTRDFVDIFADTIRESLAKEMKVKNGKNPAVTIRGLGRFTVRQRKARMGRNPQTGEPIKIKASKKLAYTGNREFRQKLKVK